MEETKKAEDYSLDQQRHFSIDIIISTPPGINDDLLTDQIIEFVEEKGYYTGGAVIEITQHGEPITKNHEE